MPDEKKIMVKVKNKVDPNVATRKDSIDLKEDSLRLLKEYQDKGYKPTTVKFPESDNEKSLNEIKERKGVTQVIRNGIRKPEKLKIEDYRQDIDENKYTQREAANGVLNMDIKPAIYDKRIKPTSSIKLMGVDAGTYNDGVNIPYYGDMEIGKKEEKKEVVEKKLEKPESNPKPPSKSKETPSPKKIMIKRLKTNKYTESNTIERDNTRVGTSFTGVDPKISMKVKRLKLLKK